MMVDLSKLAAEIHSAAVEKGFWGVEDALDKNLAKMVSEIGEIVQADRAGVLYEVEREGAKPEGVLAEMADFVMMALDILAQCDANFEAVDEVCSDYESLKIIAAITEAHKIALLFAAKLVSFATSDDDTAGSDIAFTIHVARAWAEVRGYDLFEIIRAKMEYNKSRPALHGRAY